MIWKIKKLQLEKEKNTMNNAKEIIRKTVEVGEKEVTYAIFIQEQKVYGYIRESIYICCPTKPWVPAILLEKYSMEWDGDSYVNARKRERNSNWVDIDLPHDFEKSLFKKYRDLFSFSEEEKREIEEKSKEAEEEYADRRRIEKEEEQKKEEERKKRREDEVSRIMKILEL